MVLLTLFNIDSEPPVAVAPFEVAIVPLILTELVSLTIFRFETTAPEPLG